MKLATLRGEGPDGRLVVVSRDGLRCLPADLVAPTLQVALEDWNNVLGPLKQLSEALEAGQGEALEVSLLAAPLPRAWQWLDGSAFPTHGALMQKAFNLPPIETDAPLMYQGMSHQFLGPHDDVPAPSEADGIDFEGEFGVITDAVPMGVNAKEAADHIKLIVQLNDWSLRVIAPVEMKTGFGWVRAKPACSVAPFAVTPEEIGSSWRDSRVCLDLWIDWNGHRFGAANGAAMDFGFGELVAHAAYSRSLPAGTIIGSGTVSNENCREVGSSCIAERRGIEIIDLGAPKTGSSRRNDRLGSSAMPKQAKPPHRLSSGQLLPPSDGARYRRLALELDSGGGLVLTFHEMGGAPEAAWGADDREVTVRIGGEDIGRLALALLSDRLRGQAAALEELLALCEEHEIEPELAAWT